MQQHGQHQQCNCSGGRSRGVLITRAEGRVGARVIHGLATGADIIALVAALAPIVGPDLLCGVASAHCEWRLLVGQSRARAMGSPPRCGRRHSIGTPCSIGAHWLGRVQPDPVALHMRVLTLDPPPCPSKAQRAQTVPTGK
jgi:hypothetical protein